MTRIVMFGPGDEALLDAAAPDVFDLPVERERAAESIVCDRRDLTGRPPVPRVLAGSHRAGRAESARTTRAKCRWSLLVPR